MVGVITIEQSVLGLLAVLAVFGFVRLFYKRRKQEGETVNWTPLEAVSITLTVYFAAQLVTALVLGIILGAAGWDSDRIAYEFENTPALQFMYIATIQAVSVSLVYWFLKRRQTPWSAIGWVRPRWRDILYALGGFVVYFGLYTLVAYNMLTSLFPNVDTDQQQQLGFDTATTGAGLVFIFVSLVILPPLVEEILVRGFLFTGLRNKLSVWWAAIVASVVFGAAHLEWGSGNSLLWTAAVDTFVLSLVLIWLRYKTGSLWPSITLHFIKNGLAFLALFVFKVT